MSDDIEQLTSKLISPLENKVNDLTKKTAITFWKRFKMTMAVASEPFFRKNMGERYFSFSNLFNGVVAWGIGSWAACWLGLVACSPVAAFLNNNGFHFIGQVAPYIALLVGLIMSVLYIRFGLQGLNLMNEYRQDCVAYHSRSRGEPRWGRYNFGVFLSICAVLFLFDFLVLILFVFSYSMAAKLAAEQDAAIYSRYLDLLDQQVEKEYLEKAILGQCPPEITHLNKPLPKNYKQQYRSNVAAAAVNKPVKIVARPPKSKADFISPPDDSSTRLAESTTP